MHQVLTDMYVTHPGDFLHKVFPSLYAYYMGLYDIVTSQLYVANSGVPVYTDDFKTNQ